MKRAGLVGVVLIAAFVTMGGSAWAGPALKLCVPKAAERSTLTPKHGKCKRGYTLMTLGAEGKAGAEGKQGGAGNPGPEGKQGPEGKLGAEGKLGTEGKLGPEGKNALSEEELSTLKGILRCIKSVATGIDGKPTVQFSGCNVQIVNGEGKTASVNGEGNLVIGYDENSGGFPPMRRVPGVQTGSHNLILGEEPEFTSYGGIVAGLTNSITAPFASATGGWHNTASGELSAVTGGFNSTASGELSSVSGGASNSAEGHASSISGGAENHTVGTGSSILGGEKELCATALCHFP